ncbi:hypothetical protein Cpin_0343 [Chitinophaga pinensis DSM 2588]|uniref:Uncharacterized protein n=1 Tax=Chitinophaga pinensis (strain ATCC 43595 / DSM 2588 / LMG 13176 / NBRC 15968 / NCIMB 11800 / UQM 2034) TaxID=485918 RepID=A0A979FZB5_CHIPD|nr:hypothetical protein Cpin_0343 [Chitinophaga pinensis DSM 2588]
MKTYSISGKETVTRGAKEAKAGSLSNSDNRHSPQAVSSQ